MYLMHCRASKQRIARKTVPGGVNWHKQDMAQPAFNRMGYGANQGFGGDFPASYARGLPDARR